MLVLSRRVAESLLIGDDIHVEILDISGNQVKLGITAPRQVPVLRSELAMTMRQNELASQTIPAHVLSRVLELMK
jgi:carbon storage regulator